jgi:hypothetical protein
MYYGSGQQVFSMPARTGSVGVRSAYFGAGVMLLAISICANAQIVAADTAGEDNRRCFNCHGQLHIAELSADERLSMVAAPDEGEATVAGPAARPELFMPPDALASGTHAKLDCVSCHSDAATLPHAQQLAPATCTQGCHAASGAAFRRSTHATALVRGDPLAPTCAHCHGTHDIQASSERQSKTHPLNVIKVCADCHEQHYEPTSHGRNGKEHIQTYLQSVHGRAVTEGGLAVAATCVNCHQHHEVLPTDDPKSTVSREHVSQTCGSCHVGINEAYQASVHGQKLADGDPNAPVCTDCHTAHGISRASTPNFMRDIVAECGGCHDAPASTSGGGASLYDTYRQSYHGQVTELGSMRAARCSDCHGAHDILPAEDENSRVHASNRLQTCAQCHPDANANFTLFQAHADYRDGQRYPLLLAMMAVGPLLIYGHEAAARLGRRLILPAVIAACGLLIMVLFSITSLWALVCGAIAIIAVSVVAEDLIRVWIRRAKDHHENPLVALLRVIDLRHRRYGAQLAHLGMILMVIGIAGSSLFNVKETLQVHPGHKEQVGRYLMTFHSLSEERGTNFTAVDAHVTLQDASGASTDLHPQMRYYDKSEQAHTQVALHWSLARDVYVTLAGWEDGGEIVALQIIINPLVIWIWIGGIVLSIGAIVCLLPRLLPRTATHRATVPVAVGHPIAIHGHAP